LVFNLNTKLFLLALNCCRPFTEVTRTRQMHTKLNSIVHTKAQPTSKTWHLTAITAALGVLMSLAHVDANALALGRITSLSSLGEPFVAGIDIPDINAEEIASLKATLASPEAFKTAGMEYNPALASIQITLTRRENGSNYLLLRSEKIVSDPFINLVINANWATGRIVRNYTLLLDPPVAKQNETMATAAPIAVLPAPVSPPVQTPSPASVTSLRVPAPPTPTAQVAMPKAPVATKSGSSAQKPTTTNSGEQVTVSTGDTAGKIAANNLPANVSLDQMLAAMLRGNPQAFIGNNINRLKAGVILDLPTEEQAAALSASEARQSLVAQSKDFSSFRRKLAENAPALTSKAKDRVAGGKIEAKVDDQKAAVVTPDKLTLSKGGLTATDKSSAATKESLEKIARERQAKDDAARSAELAKNIKDLNNIASATPATSEKAAPTAAVVAVPAVPPMPASPATPKPPVVAKAPVVVAPVAEPSAIDSLMEDPVVLPAAGGLLIALLAGGLYANNKRKNKIKAAEAAEDALLDAQEHEESFFSDTSNEPVMEKEAVSTEAEQLEQEKIAPIETIETPEINTATLDTRAVVDPLTEANVYLDYGRDVQAEEILKDGLKTQPQNVAIYAKLMDIYAQRRDAKSFETMALKAKILLSEDSVQWQTISKQGFDLEPQNPLYRVAAPEQEDPLANLSELEFSSRTVAHIDPESAKAPASVDLDLDFNFASSFPSPAAKPEAKKAPLVDLPDFSLEPAETSTAVHVAAASVATTATHALSESSPLNQTPQAMEFDLGNLSLDLNNTGKTISTPNVVSVVNDGPFETKLALAQEFRAIGDTAGAKMLANEVLATATGNLKKRAEAFLAEIS
jgi:pilus assembly protein FimV